MTDPAWPDRPDHPDFWLISQGLIEQDAQAEQGQHMDEMVQRYVDLPSLHYAATQRAGMMAHIASKGRLVVSAQQLEVAIGAAWLDAFVQGARFQALKDAGGAKIPDNVEDL